MHRRKRIAEACRLNGEWLSDFGWCKGFKPEDFAGKHVLVRTESGSEIRGALAHAATEENSGRIFLEAGDVSALCEDCVTRKTIGPVVLERKDPAGPAGSILDAACTWDEVKSRFVGGRIMGQSSKPAAMRRARIHERPLPEPVLWETVAGIDDIAFVWDEQDYASISASRVKEGEMAILGTRLYPITEIYGKWITVDAGRVTILKSMAAGFLSADLAD